MIIIDFFLGVIFLFVILVLGLGLSLWFNVRRHLSPFLRADEFRQPQNMQDIHPQGEVIEGEYQVIDEREE